ncbi:uncharacterized protein LOC130714948 [Lotus japonicus]|uniref:uncharacterized protein LOC130714948 n=1 Tax=Lotus japonicus TaxID=34305 RepID=UPI002583A4CD|nr:uncharacterized protein LOC130714948 [Lotus japonicus]
METTTRSQTLSPTSSPEFEFWMVRNPSFPQPNILSADELFVDGVLLPLHLLPTTTKPDPLPKPDPETPTSAPIPEPSPAITDSVTSTPSKRWKDIFRKSDKKTTAEDNNEKPKKKEKKGGTGGGAAASAATELNINIWPFSRSRSAGNTGTRPRLFAPAARKVNSAPCSRSNSAGESKSRKFPSSPARVGVHVGRSSPVWQVRRGASASASKNAAESLPLNREKSKRETSTSCRSKLASSGADTRAKVLNVNVPICIGNHLSCRSDGNSGGSDYNSGGSDFRGSYRGHSDVGGKIFNLRSFFSKKSIVTSH